MSLLKKFQLRFLKRMLLYWFYLSFLSWGLKVFKLFRFADTKGSLNEFDFEQAARKTFCGKPQRLKFLYPSRPKFSGFCKSYFYQVFHYGAYKVYKTSFVCLKNEISNVISISHSSSIIQNLKLKTCASISFLSKAKTALFLGLFAPLAGAGNAPISAKERAAVALQQSSLAELSSLADEEGLKNKETKRQKQSAGASSLELGAKKSENNDDWDAQGPIQDSANEGSSSFNETAFSVEPNKPFQLNFKAGLASSFLVGAGQIGALLELESSLYSFNESFHWLAQLGIGSRNLWETAWAKNPYFMGALGFRVGNVWVFSITGACLYSLKQDRYERHFRYSVNMSAGRWFRFSSINTLLEAHIAGLNKPFLFPPSLPYVALSLSFPLASF